MQASVDLAKLVGVVGDAIIVPGRTHDRFEVSTTDADSLRNTDGQLDGEADSDEGYDFVVSQLFRRRYD
jgi:hypothetical protein